MIPKPSGCDTCPLAKCGKYYTPDVVVPGSKVFFLAQNPGPDEEEGKMLIERNWNYGKPDNTYRTVQPQPLIGATGKMFNERFLPLAGLKRGEVSLGNAIRCRPGKDLNLRADELPTITKTMKLETSRADLVKAMKHCRDTYLQIPNSVELVVTMGRYAMFSLTGIQNEEQEYGRRQGVMESWRGYAVDVPSFDNWKTVDTSYYHPLLGEKKIFFTMHLAALFRGMNKKYFHGTLLDFTKIKRILNKEWPLTPPSWKDTPPTQWPKYSTFDSEYIPNQKIMKSWSLCDSEDNIWNIHAENTPYHPIPTNQQSTVIIQNAVTSDDLYYLKNIVNLSHIKVEDLMMADSVLNTGEPHSLNYINSKYGSLNRYKHLSEGDPDFYGAMDVWEPMYSWRHFYMPSFKEDIASWRVYKNYTMTMLPVILKAQERGAKVNTTRLTEVQSILQERLARYQERAREITGNPQFKLGGRKDLMYELYEVID